MFTFIVGLHLNHKCYHWQISTFALEYVVLHALSKIKEINKTKIFYVRGPLNHHNKWLIILNIFLLNSVLNSAIFHIPHLYLIPITKVPIPNNHNPKRSFIHLPWTATDDQFSVTDSLNKWFLFAYKTGVSFRNTPPQPIPQPTHPAPNPPV